MKVSLGLLPSGPDPVGEEHVRANLPDGYMARDCGERKMQPMASFAVCSEHQARSSSVIAKGSQDEAEVRRHVANWQGRIAHWNVLADSFRDAARGRSFATETMLGEADRTRQEILSAMELADRLTDSLASGHDLRRDLFQLVSAMEAISESIAISGEAMVPLIEASKNIAGLKFLLGALRRDAGLEGPR